MRSSELADHQDTSRPIYLSFSTVEASHIVPSTLLEQNQSMTPTSQVDFFEPCVCHVSLHTREGGFREGCQGEQL